MKLGAWIIDIIVKKNLLDYIKEYQPDVVITVRDESVYLTQEGNGAIS